MKRQLAVMLDPLLLPGSSHTATISFPVAPAGLACTVELFLSKDGGVTKAATSGPIAFTSTGAAQSVALPIVMPSAGGYTYAAFVDVVSSGVLIAAYQATENVVIPSVGQPTITWAGGR